MQMLDLSSKAYANSPRRFTSLETAPLPLNASFEFASKTCYTAPMQRFTLEFATEGNNDVINVSPDLQKRLSDFRVSGLVHLFVVGSTAAITIMEFEPGLVNHDLRNMLQRIIPDDAHYEHERT